MGVAGQLQRGADPLLPAISEIIMVAPALKKSAEVLLTARTKQLRFPGTNAQSHGTPGYLRCRLALSFG